MDVDSIDEDHLLHQLAQALAEMERLRAAAKLVVETWDAEDHPVPMQNLRRAIEGLRK